MRREGLKLKAQSIKPSWLITTFSFQLFAFSLFAQSGDDDILDIRPMRGAGFWEANWQWAVPVIVGVLVVAGIAAFFALRRKPEKPLTAYQRAMKEIAEASRLKDGGDDKAFSIAVSNALRNYIEAVFRIRAPEQTTEEFLSNARSHPRISEEALITLGAFLELCDLAKFARHAFGPEERDQLLVTAKEFVEQAQRRLREQRQMEGGGS